MFTAWAATRTAGARHRGWWLPGHCVFLFCCFLFLVNAFFFFFLCVRVLTTPPITNCSSKDLVILLHDMLTEGGSGSFFLPLMLELRAAGHRSCAVDAAGHGFSTAFHGSATEYAGRRSRVAAAEAVEALVDAGELREIAQGEDPDSRWVVVVFLYLFVFLFFLFFCFFSNPPLLPMYSEYESARGDRVVIVGFGTGSYAARFMSQLVMTKGRPGASGDLRPAPTVHLEPSTPSSPLMRAPHLASRSSLVEMFHIFSYIGVTRWAVIAGAHPMLGAVSKAGPPLRDIFEHELAAPRAHGSEIAGLAVLKDIHTEARAQLPGYNRKKKDAASDSAAVPEGPVAAVLIGDSETPGPAGDSDVRGAQVDEMRTFAKAVKARATTTIRGARRLVHVDEPVQVARAIGKALQV
jgi:hypothetical protein